MTKSLVEALRSKTNALDAYVFGDHARDGTHDDVLEELDAGSVVEAIEDLHRRIDEVEADAHLAKATATSRTVADGGSRSKKDVALELSRDELVRQVLVGESGSTTDIKTGEKHRVGASLEVGDVRRMARPQTELKWKTIVRDAWPELVERWPCFRVDDDPKRLVIAPEDVPPELARLVEDSLDRDDLANQVVGATASVWGGSR
jgi:hypothetical protein